MNSFEDRLNENLENWSSLSFMGKLKTAFAMTVFSVLGLTGLVVMLAGMYFFSEVMVTVLN